MKKSKHDARDKRRAIDSALERLAAEVKRRALANVRRACPALFDDEEPPP